jgi:hypothetical protein
MLVIAVAGCRAVLARDGIGIPVEKSGDEISETRVVIPQRS